MKNPDSKARRCGVYSGVYPNVRTPRGTKRRATFSHEFIASVEIACNCTRRAATVSTPTFIYVGGDIEFAFDLLYFNSRDSHELVHLAWFQFILVDNSVLHAVIPISMRFYLLFPSFLLSVNFLLLPMSHYS